MPRHLVSWFALLCSCLPLSAQQFTSARVLPVDGDPQVLVTADLNRDGIPDLVYTDAPDGGRLHVLLGLGDGTFAPGQVISLPDGVGTTITVADLNLDGIPDLLLGYDGNAAYTPGTVPATPGISVFLGVGDGTFGQRIANPLATADSPTEINTHMAVADFDGDGLPDLALTDGTSVYLLHGDGAGHLTPASDLPNIAFFGDLLTADLNGDGKPDLISPSTEGINVLLNTGSGFAAPVFYPNNLYDPYPGTVALTDFDGDGRPDLLFSDSEHLPTTNILFRHGNPDGTFGPATIVGSYFGPKFSFAGITDVNGDGKPDLLSAGNSGLSVSLSSPGRLGNLPPALYATSGFLAQWAVMADFSGTGHPAVILPADHALVLLPSNPDGTFAAAAVYPTPFSVGGLFVADVNRDGLPDVVAADFGQYPATFLGRGDGTLRTPPIATGVGGHDGCGFPIYPGDFNGDGLIDYSCWQFAQLGNGDGSFGADLGLPLNLPGSGPTVFWNGYWASADFNNDGLTDVAGAYGPNVDVATSVAPSVYAGTTTPLGGVVGPMISADFNGDGCADLATTASASVVILRGDCHGNLAQTVTYPTGFDPADSTGVVTDIAVADLDRDGHPDLLVAIPGASLLKVFYGRGDGTFDPAQDLPTSRVNSFVTPGDLDNDGYPDLVLDGFGLVTVIHTLPGRRFGPESFLAANPSTGKPVLGDLNRDGNLDIVIPSQGPVSDLIVNTFDFTVLLSGAPARPSPLLNATLAISPEPSLLGQTVTVTAAFFPVSNPATPIGPVTFTVDGAPAATVPLTPGGKAVFTTATLTVGPHTVVASFPGDANFLAASATRQHLVAGVTVALSLSATPNPAAIGQPITITYGALNGTGAPLNAPGPAGTLTLSADGTSIATSPVAASATLTHAFPTAGAHSITLTYSGDTLHTAASTTLTLNVAQLATGLTLQISPTQPTFGQPAVFAAMVLGPASNALRPTGAVLFTFCNGATAAATLTPSGLATAAFPIAGTPPQPVGPCLTTATYAGDTNFLLSSSTLTYAVVPAPSTTSFTASPNPSNLGQVVSLHILVAGLVPATTDPLSGLTVTPPSLAPGGALTIFDGRNTLGTLRLVNGAATLSTAALALGTHTLTAAYSGDGNLLPSTSAPLTVTVVASGFSLSISPSALTLAPGATAAVAIAIVANGGFSGTLQVAAGALPSSVSAILTPSIVSLSAGTGASSTLHLNAAPAALAGPASTPAGNGPRLAVFAVLLLPLASRRARWLGRTLLTLLLAAAAIFSATGCGELRYLVPGAGTTYTIPITATDTRTGHTETANLVLTLSPQ